MEDFIAASADNVVSLHSSVQRTDVSWFRLEKLTGTRRHSLSELSLFLWRLVWGPLNLSFKGHCPWFWCGQGEKSVWFIKLASFISTWAGREVCVLDFKGPVVSYFDVGRLRSMLWKASSVTLPLPSPLSLFLSLSFFLFNVFSWENIFKCQWGGNDEHWFSASQQDHSLREI